MAKTKVKKSEKKRRAKQEKELKDKLYAYLKDYGGGVNMQTPDKAETDRQLQSIATFLSSLISTTSQGTMVDIGCGEGVLLARLAGLPAFREKELWNYFGVDYPEMSKILNYAVEAGIHRKTDFVTLDVFYSNWPDRSKLPKPHTVIIRNVLHELEIDETARLITHISNNMLQGEVAIIQDLTVFPKAEKGQCCWGPEYLRNVFSCSGFDISVTPERSSSGNRWFNLIATRNEKGPFQIEDIRTYILKERMSQYDEWKKKGALLPDDELFRSVQIAKIDFDLQFAALTLQLQRAGVGLKALSDIQESLVHRSTFIKHLRDFRLYVPKRDRLATSFSSHFRDRAHSLNALVEFFTSDYSVTLISGPTLMGKSELARHFLCSEDFHHSRLPIFVDLLTTSSAFNLLDQILSQMGCMIPNDILLRMSNVMLEDIREQLQEFFHHNAIHIVVVIDHLERVTDPSGLIPDKEVQMLLNMLADGKGAKLILTSRRDDTELSFLPSGVLDPARKPNVGRFPEKHHVINVLQSFILLSEYPEELLQAMDQHPFLVYLTGVYLQTKGQEGAKDKELLEDLRLKLRDAIFAKILTPEARPAIEAISRLRIPVPRDMVVALSSAESVRAAEGLGLIRSQSGGMRDDLVWYIQSLRITTEVEIIEDVSTEETENKGSLLSGEEKSLHQKIADLYEQNYRKSDDPIWLYEAYFHRMICSSHEELNIFGRRFSAEFFAAAEYWYNHTKNFREALWAYQRAYDYGQTGYQIRMRLASCKLRLASNTEDEKKAREEFEALIRNFPGEYGIKTAYIDAILYKKDYTGAINQLQKLALKQTDGWWVAGQYGRAYSGLHEHRKAIEAFGLQLQEKPEAMVYEQIARAYHRMGDTEMEAQKIDQGFAKYPLSQRLLIYKGSLLERIGQTNDALVILNGLLSKDPSNGWVFFPYLKAMDRLGKLGEVIQHWKIHNQRIIPEYLKIPIEADLLVRQRRHHDAIMKLHTLPIDEHSIGQLLEAYLGWANSQEDVDEKRRIAAEALAITIDPIISKNVPVIITRGKLAIAAQNKDVCEDTINKIKVINPSVAELARLQANYDMQWPRNAS